MLDTIWFRSPRFFRRFFFGFATVGADNTQISE